MPSAPDAYHHGSLESALVEAATEMIEERGLAALSLREVARAVGVSHAAPYRHFPNKEALLEAIAIEGFNDLTRALDVVIAAHPDDPERQMIEGGAAYIREAVASPQRSQLMLGGALQNRAQTKALTAAAEASFARCIQIIQHGQESGVFRSGPTRGMVLTYWAATHGMAMLLIADQFAVQVTAGSAQAAWEQVAAELLAGITAPDG